MCTAVYTLKHQFCRADSLLHITFGCRRQPPAAAVHTYQETTFASARDLTFLAGPAVWFTAALTTAAVAKNTLTVERMCNVFSTVVLQIVFCALSLNLNLS